MINQFELLACLSVFDKSIRVDNFRQMALFDLSHSYEPTIVEKARHVAYRCRELGATILYPGHSNYPNVFYDLEEPPTFLSVLGASAWQGRECLSVVGSRDPQRMTLDWLELHLAESVKAQKWTIVSGGARGVDQKAHAISLRLGLPTIVFLPSGLANPYPVNLGSWIREIVRSGGAILSEFAPDEPMRKSHFERRNRMIAAMGTILLVAEARRKSGSLITARHAREASRSICVLPTFPGDARTDGALDLLFDGAFPLRDGSDLVSLYDLSAPRPAQTPKSSN
jgi:DNA processing protein